jgi:hypothetical protein
MPDLPAKKKTLRGRLSHWLLALKFRQAELRHWLSGKLRSAPNYSRESAVDIVVAHCEVNSRQGVGILLRRLFPNNENIFSARSRNLYDGEQDFGFAHACVSHADKGREAVASKLSKTLGSLEVRRVLSVPYYTDDVLSSIALKDRFGVPLCTYLMDDQNVYVQEIPDDCMRELLEKSDLRLGISRELCEAYESKYGLKFWFLPPLVDGHLIQADDAPLPGNLDQGASQPVGVLIGNIWSQQWLDCLRDLTRQTGMRLEWYGNPNRSWLEFDEDRLREDGIDFKGYYPEDELVEALRKSTFAVIPTGTTEDALDRPELARLSLPSRITYLTSVANIPLLVVGSRETAAARFVEDMGLGVVCDYTAGSFQRAVTEICSEVAQSRMRKRAGYLAPSLSAENMDTWIWRSLERGRAINFRFEQLGHVLSNASAVVTAFEINDLHGTGPLVSRIVEGTPQVLSIHSMDLYNGEHYFGDLSLFISHDRLTREEASEQVITKLGDNHVSQILCVPYRADDLITSIALAEHCGAPLGVYIMDDQNVYARVIPDKLMREFLTRCNIRFATHPELRDAYEEKYGLKFYLLPAVVPHELVYQSSRPHDFRERRPDQGVLIGSLWSKRWYDMLSDAARGAGVRLDWYGNTKYPWMDIEIGQELQHGIVAHGIVSETELVEKMKQAAFVVVPTGTLDARDERKELALLSLPGRIILAMATSNTPVIIMGSKDSGAAHFVERFGVGVTCDYAAESLREAVDFVTEPQMQRKMRERAAKLGSRFSVDQMHEWLWESIRLGRPRDGCFEELFPRDQGIGT